MKRILSCVLVIFTLLSVLSGCNKDKGNKEKDRILYSEFDLLKNVTLAEYKEIKVDTSSEKFKEFYTDALAGDVEEYNLYVKKTEGEVVEGDTVNIDYVGKKDNIAFDGGTAEGYDLTIGSNSFIDGFEDGLIGKTIGSTVDLNLTFPENYQSEELAGEDVVFTVKINYATTTEPMEPQEYFEEIGFSSLEEYEESVKKTAVENYLLEEFISNSKVNKYSSDDENYLLEAYLKTVENNLQNQYGMTLDSYLSTMGQTLDELKESIINEQIKPAMDSQMPIYALLDKEGIEIKKTDINDEVNEIIASYGNSEITAEDLIEYYGEYYFENLIAVEKALELMSENAVIS